MNKPSAIRFSHEFFPHRDDNMQPKLWWAVGQLERLDPLFFSMTYAALGSAQQVSIESAITMHHESPVAVAEKFYDAGIRRFVALRGDPVAEATADSRLSPGKGF